jgi:3-mercaptopropionate dioxygenase
LKHNINMKRSELIGPFATFLDEMDALFTTRSSEAHTLNRAETSLRGLLASALWLPAEYTQANPEKYQQLALYVDPQSRYSVVSFVWGPGQATPIHNHTVWGLVGVLDGAETCEEFTRDAAGTWRPSHAHPLPRGAIDRVSPSIGDVHRVSNAMAGQTTVSIHVYGGNIGRIARSVFDADGTVRPFVSGYSNSAPWVHA